MAALFPSKLTFPFSLIVITVSKNAADFSHRPAAERHPLTLRARRLVQDDHQSSDGSFFPVYHCH
jgi:hypothetical protein